VAAAGRPWGAVAAGPPLHDGDWTSLYECTGGAAWAGRQVLTDAEQRHQVMLDWYQIVYVYGVHPYAAHRAFLVIAEYQDIIQEMGCGPDKDEPNVGYGRVCSYPVPELNIFTRYSALYVWPAKDRPGWLSKARCIPAQTHLTLAVKPFAFVHEWVQLIVKSWPFVIVPVRDGAEVQIVRNDRRFQFSQRRLHCDAQTSPIGVFAVESPQRFGFFSCGPAARMCGPRLRATQTHDSRPGVLPFGD
jgi:hypothetical protein